MYKGKRIIALCISKADNYTDFISSLNESVSKNGGKLFIYHTCSDLYWNNKVEKSEKAVFDLIDYDVVDAVIVYSDAFYDKDIVKKIIAKADENNKPVIVIGENDEKHISMIFDDKKGFESIVRHVIEFHKVRDIHFIAGIKGEQHSENRIAAFKKVLDDNGIPFSEDMISYGDYWHMPTKKAVAELIQSHKLPRAIICANDSMAITVCEELEKNNISVPNDVLVTGFDGLKETEYCNPPVSTCKYDLPLFIDKLAKLLNSALVGENVSGNYSIDFSPIIYSSCGCKNSISKKNLGGLLKNSDDRFNGYRENERTLHELLEKSVMCDSSDEITEQLKQFSFGNIMIAINSSCFDSAVNPLNECRTRTFDEKMVLAYPACSKDTSLPQRYNNPEIISIINDFMNGKNPIIFTALGFMGTPFGFIAGNTDVNFEDYGRIQLYANSINTIIGCNRNVRYIKYASKQIEKMSMLDHMTGMYNRSGFYNYLNDFTAKALNEGKRIAVVSIDADGLKYVNDNFGHSNGDFIISTAADALKSLSPKEKICGRFGGDELAACIIVGKNDNVQQRIKGELKSYLDRINETSLKPFDVSVSVGIELCDAEGFDFDKAYRSADKKMYEDKQSKGVRR